jgi:hypothetical protein
VELFGLVAPASPVKYVMPCPGLVTFAGLEADRYLRVSDPSACDRERGAVVPSGLVVGE